MEWIVDPLCSFNALDTILADSCPNVFNQCSCQGGLNVCTVEAALRVAK